MLAIDEFDFKISPNYLYFISDKDFEILFKKLPKEDILLLALKYKKFSDELKKELQKNPDYIKDIKITKLDKYKLDEKYISEDIILNNNYLINILNDEQLIVFAQNKYLENNNDYEFLIRFIEVLEKEDNKYNMIKDIHSERQRTFKAYNLEIKNRIKELKDKLNQKKI